MELVGVREDVAFAIDKFEVSERRACELNHLDRSSYRYQPKPDRNAELRKKLTALAREKPRWGYRRLGVLLEQKGTCSGREVAFTRKTNHVNSRVARSFGSPKNRVNSTTLA